LIGRQTGRYYQAVRRFESSFEKGGGLHWADPLNVYSGFRLSKISRNHEEDDKMEEERHEQISDLQEQLQQGKITRRDFLRGATLLGVSLGAAQALAGCATPTPEVIEKTVEVPVEVTRIVEVEPETVVVTATPEPEPEEAPAAAALAGHMIVFDPIQCTGCMMCAVACAEKWAAEIAPEETKDTVNLEFSRIRPMRFQYVDVIDVCQYCDLMEWAEGSSEHPCQAVCPTDAIVTVPEGEGKPGLTGMGYMTVDRDKCLGVDACSRCLEICEDQFGSGISFDPIEGKAQICTRCGGDPACVKVCPENALHFVPVMRNGRYYAQTPEAKAELLYMKMFNKRRDL
jgi:carbon-monoxide dehydrogenase iron sulfur subunit